MTINQQIDELLIRHQRTCIEHLLNQLGMNDLNTATALEQIAADMRQKLAAEWADAHDD